MMHRVPNTITQRNKALHAKQRRVLSHGFSDRAMRNYEEVIAAHADKFCRHLTEDEGQLSQMEGASAKREWSAPKDMAHWCKSGAVRS